MSASPLPWEKYSASDSGPWAKYAQPQTAPNAGLAPAAGPSKEMDSGEGPIAAGLTSFETQLSKAPGAILHRIAHPFRSSEEYERESKLPVMQQLGAALSPLNPVVKTDAGTPNEQVDVGATAANVLPAILDVRGGGIKESPVGEITPPIVRGAVRGINRGLENAETPSTILGGGIGATLGRKTGIPFGGTLGGAAGLGIGAKIGRKLSEVRIPGEDFGLNPGDVILKKMQPYADKIMREGHGPEPTEEQASEPTLNVQGDLSDALKESLRRVKAAKAKPTS